MQPTGQLLTTTLRVAAIISCIAAADVFTCSGYCSKKNRFPVGRRDIAIINISKSDTVNPTSVGSCSVKIQLHIYRNKSMFDRNTIIALVVVGVILLLL
ncbi:hypothetical protein KKC97_01410, partial [bacterium]|nr:hypothetical protein [bacterium]